MEKDKRKEEHLKKAGFHVLRFGDEEILNSISRVIETIDSKIKEIERSTFLTSKEEKATGEGHPLAPASGGQSQ